MTIQFAELPGGVLINATEIFRVDPVPTGGFQLTLKDGTTMHAASIDGLGELRGAKKGTTAIGSDGRLWTVTHWRIGPCGMNRPVLGLPAASPDLTGIGRAVFGARP